MGTTLKSPVTLLTYKDFVLLMLAWRVMSGLPASINKNFCYSKHNKVTELQKLPLRRRRGWEGSASCRSTSVRCHRHMGPDTCLGRQTGAGRGLPALGNRRVVVGVLAVIKCERVH